jgi:hypothetical protein
MIANKVDTEGGVFYFPLLILMVLFYVGYTYYLNKHKYLGHRIIIVKDKIHVPKSNTFGENEEIQIKSKSYLNGLFNVYSRDLASRQAQKVA